MCIPQRLGTSFSPPNATAASSPSNPRTDGLRLLGKTGMLNASTVLFVESTWRGKVSMQRVDGPIARNTLAQASGKDKYRKSAARG